MFTGSVIPLMELSGSPPDRGCTILLCGKSYSELKRVKEVMRRSLLLAYHARLAVSYLADENAMLSQSAIARVMSRVAIGPQTSDTALPMLNAEQPTGSGCPQEMQFRRALANTVLSLSPFVDVPPPYLETERVYNDVRNSARDYLPSGLYWSLQFEMDDVREALRRDLLVRCNEYARRRLLVVKSPLLLRPETARGKEHLANAHPFLVQPLLSTADAPSASSTSTTNGYASDSSDRSLHLSRSRLALFRAHGSSVQYANVQRAPVLMSALAERAPTLLAQHALPKFGPLNFSLVPDDVSIKYLNFRIFF